MKHVLTGILSTAAIYGWLAATPVAAQVAGNPGDMHTPTPYTSDFWARTHGYDYGSYRYEPGFAGPFAPVGAVLGGVGALGAGVVGTAGAVGAGVAGATIGGPAYAVQPHAGCGIIKDFNGRYTSVCGP